MRYRYIKLMPVTVSIPVIPFFSLLTGVLLLLWVVLPITQQLLFVKSSSSIVTPVAEDFIKTASAFGQDTSDLTKASNWFPRYHQQNAIALLDSYTLSIPKLRIQNALVRVGTDDLSKSLIHYGGTGLPGKYGSAVIFGHSILPQFYDPANYISIFSLLYQLKEGDDMFVHADGVDYRYKVTELKAVNPDDVSGLEQRFDNSYISLVTCFPSGTYLRRLWVTAKEVPFGNKV